jgi:hypothetical protein
MVGQVSVRDFKSTYGTRWVVYENQVADACTSKDIQNSARRREGL